MGLPSVESLLAERDTLVTQIAPLRAVHGPFGTYGDQRKILLAQLAARLRAEAVASGTRVTEAALDEAAHAHPEYVAFVTEATQQKADYFVLENRIDGIADTISRGQAVARYLAAEVGLSR